MNSNLIIIFSRNLRLIIYLTVNQCHPVDASSSIHGSRYTCGTNYLHRISSNFYKILEVDYFKFTSDKKQSLMNNGQIFQNCFQTKHVKINFYSF